MQLAFLRKGVKINSMKKVKSLLKKAGKRKLPFKLNLSERTKKILIVVLSLVIIVGLLFNLRHLYLAALVNKQPVFRWTLYRELEKQGGQQVLDSMINQALILQEAEKQNINISQTEIEAKLNEFRSQVEEQGGSLEDFLLGQGMSLTELEKQIRIQLIIDEILGKDIEIAEEDLVNYFEENQDYFEEGATFEETRADLEEELRQQELVEKFQVWIEELKLKAKIESYL